jgi:hypothetical protein
MGAAPSDNHQPRFIPLNRGFWLQPVQGNRTMGTDLLRGVLPVARRLWAFLALALLVECLGLAGIRYPIWRWISMILVVAILLVGVAAAVRDWLRQDRLNPSHVMRYQPVRRRHWHW